MDERSRNEVSPHHHHHHLMKLELRLAPPGADEQQQQQHWSLINGIRTTTTKRDESSSSVLSLGYFPHHHHHATTKASPSPSPPPPPQPLQNNNNNADKKVFSPSSANTPLPNNISQKRTAPGPVVGWPPIRSFRKNLASSSSSKPPPPPPDHHNKVAAAAALDKNNNSSYGGGKGMFVKINMDGVPIGRKVDLNAYDSYENLSNAVDQLFRGLLAAQRDSSGGGVNKLQEEEKVITGLLDGSGEYTLVYEDNEGDRMLVGDVPWHMFVSTVKRLRVLKSSELSAFTLGGNKQDKDAT
ncbi:Auxin-responsive protein iaa26 [Stylosanthes scabra]|uniref:Auxin-induced protein n=1 Tax=Stylosanthes scabra TaxID=79078 RepID=A0ABU6QP45_9FABA|nr:Auxin-responsive protein iaa26 [Stylosanthes scabra]